MGKRHTGAGGAAAAAAGVCLQKAPQVPRRPQQEKHQQLLARGWRPGRRRQATVACLP